MATTIGKPSYQKNPHDEQGQPSLEATRSDDGFKTEHNLRAQQSRHTKKNQNKNGPTVSKEAILVLPEIVEDLKPKSTH